MCKLNRGVGRPPWSPSSASDGERFPGYGHCAGGGEERHEECQRDDAQAEGSERKDVDGVKAIDGYARSDVCRAGKGAHA
jgi:hypothetical protein